MSGLTIIDHAGPSPKQWDMTIRGMRNSWESWEKGDSQCISPATWTTDFNEQAYSPEAFDLGLADRDLALRLGKLGADHGKYLRQLPVIVEIRAPGYFWREFDTYRIGVEASDITQNSTSMMHTLGKEPFSEEMFYMEDMHPDVRKPLIDFMNTLRDLWILKGNKRKGPEIPEWRALQQALPFGILYTRTVSLNYQVLRSMYHARKNHRLAEWRTFCDWMTTLEYSELITTEAKV